jgi:hypothetical protein
VPGSLIVHADGTVASCTFDEYAELLGDKRGKVLLRPPAARTTVAKSVVSCDWCAVRMVATRHKSRWGFRDRSHSSIKHARRPSPNR